MYTNNTTTIADKAVLVTVVLRLSVSWTCVRWRP